MLRVIMVRGLVNKHIFEGCFSELFSLLFANLLRHRYGNTIEVTWVKHWQQQRLSRVQVYGDRFDLEELTINTKKRWVNKPSAQAVAANIWSSLSSLSAIDS